MAQSNLPIRSNGAATHQDTGDNCTMDIRIDLQRPVGPPKEPNENTSVFVPRSVMPIDTNWEFTKQPEPHESGEWLPVSQFPTMVHLDLMHHGKLPDPYMGTNEKNVQWINEESWVYRTTFPTPEQLLGPSPLRQAHTALVFEGLDTIATVVLNGRVILKADNMFTPWRVPVTEYLRRGNESATNQLVITFHSALLHGKKIEKEHPSHKWGCWNGDTSRLAVRKAQYHWGWDWGPTLMTCGPWRPVTLEIFESRISDLWCEVDVDPSLQKAAIIARASIDGAARKVRFDLSLGGLHLASQEVSSNSPQVTFNVKQPALWYPARYGAQPLYTVKATLVQDDTELDTLSKKIGLRRAELRQRPDEFGSTFFFRINNIPIFCGGTDWIPADNFFPRITRQRYYDWVKLAADGNQAMIRVWGGGIYEDPAFYEACDELGVLVWQDFMFACGNYPAFEAMRVSIEREAVINVRRLRHHPCIVIFAGNNEDYQYAESEELGKDQDEDDPESWLNSDFPARYIYEKILPDVCRQLCPSIAYHPGSPWGGKTTKDAGTGDIHQWDVWHGDQMKYQDFDQLWGRFVSEFGMEAFPDIRTVDSFLPLGAQDPDRYAQSATVDFHNKADGHERRLALYMVENLRYGPDPLEQYIYLTQLMQSECLTSAYQAWKRLWKGRYQEYCGGALAWQLNDCWPGTSWAIVDYYLRPKMAYYTIKRELALLSLGMKRLVGETVNSDGSEPEDPNQLTIAVWATNLGKDRAGPLQVICGAWDITTGEEVQITNGPGNAPVTGVINTGRMLEPCQSTELAVLAIPKTPREIVVAVRLQQNIYEEGGVLVNKQVARCVNWPQPLKYLHFQRPKELRAELNAKGDMIEVSAEVPVKGVMVSVHPEDVPSQEKNDRVSPTEVRDNIQFDDNLVDVVPGEVVYIPVRGAKEGMRFTTRYLGME